MNLKTISAALFLSSMNLIASPANSAHVGREAIQAQQGCYEVTFEFHETFKRLKDHPISSAPHSERALEWVHVDEVSETHVALQHILVIPGMGSLKHWRQEWDYEPEHLFQFKANNEWEKSFLNSENSRGLWAQRVYQVDDSPRYECAAPWISWADKSYWECQTWSPLPRREFSKRSDYNVLNRRNRHEIFAWGWKHEQDNEKIKTTAAETTLIAEEKGINTYRKVEDSRCQEAKNWWLENRGIWHAIQKTWLSVYTQSVNIKLKGPINGKTLWMRLFELADQAAQTKMPPPQIEEAALAIINQYRH